MSLIKVFAIATVIALCFVGVHSFSTIDHFTDSQCTQLYARETYKPTGACPVKVAEPSCNPTSIGTYSISNAIDCLNDTLPNLIDQTWTQFTFFYDSSCTTNYPFKRFELKNSTFTALVTDNELVVNFTYSCVASTGELMLSACVDVDPTCLIYPALPFNTCTEVDGQGSTQGSCKKSDTTPTPSATAPNSTPVSTNAPNKKSSADKAMIGMASIVGLVLVL